MKFRAAITCLASLFLFTMAVAFRSEWVDLVVRCAVWGGLLLGSVILTIGPTLYERWQNWMFDENGTPKM
jgi:RsiW-degrading membrane proteinase PrsW (M82 family)